MQPAGQTCGANLRGKPAEKKKIKGLDNNWDFVFTGTTSFFQLASMYLQQYYKNPEEFKSSLPVYLDATCTYNIQLQMLKMKIYLNM